MYFSGERILQVTNDSDNVLFIKLYKSNELVNATRKMKRINLFLGLVSLFLFIRYFQTDSLEYLLFGAMGMGFIFIVQMFRSILRQNAYTNYEKKGELLSQLSMDMDQKSSDDYPLLFGLARTVEPILGYTFEETETITPRVGKKIENSIEMDATKTIFEGKRHHYSLQYLTPVIVFENGSVQPLIPINDNLDKNVLRRLAHGYYKQIYNDIYAKYPYLKENDDLYIELLDGDKTIGYVTPRNKISGIEAYPTTY